MKFPHVVTKNLAGQKVNLPQDFPGEFTYAVISYSSDQKSQVADWVRAINAIKYDHPQIDVVEINILAKANPISRWLNIFDQQADSTSGLSDSKTILIHSGSKEFNKVTQIVTGEGTIQVFLINHEGRVLWRIEGERTAEREQRMHEFVNGLFTSSEPQNAS